MFALRMKLVQALEQETDLTLANILHKACVILYAHVSGTVVDAPGRIIPILLTALSGKVKDDALKKLTEAYGVLLKQVQESGDCPQAVQIEALAAQVKTIALDKSVVLAAE
eukprot:c19159_g1_i1.p2 GENE.c19159_g1_i1~~c19159_g1_i1.p2  ORF type:complete len:111 (+),score=35.43 c19159_g1_i1:246-578(+)